MKALKTISGLALALGAAAVQAQVVVEVKDDSGRLLPDARVTLIGPERTTNRGSVATSDRRGIASFNQSQSGRYFVVATKNNYQVQYRDFNVSNGRPTNVELRLGTNTSSPKVLFVVRNTMNEPVNNALINVSAVNNGRTNYSERTRNGLASIQIANDRNARYTARIEHNDYEARSTNVQISDRGDTLSLIQLEARTVADRTVVVRAVESGNRNPISRARVTFETGNRNDTRSATTDSNGSVSVRLNQRAIYNVTIENDSFQTYTDRIDLSRPNDNSNVNKQYELRRTNGNGNGNQRSDVVRLVKIVVRGRNLDRREIPLRNANVTLSNGASGRTDSNGNVVFLVDALNRSSITGHVDPDGAYQRASFGSVSTRGNVTLDSQTLSRNTWLRPYQNYDLRRSVPSNIADQWSRAFGSTNVNQTTITVNIGNGPGPGPGPGREDPKLSGDIRLSSGRVKLGDTVTADIGAFYKDTTANRASANVSVRVTGPSGRVVASDDYRADMVLNTYSRKKFEIRTSESGTHTVKVTVTSNGMKTWSDQKTFSVDRRSGDQNPAVDGTYSGNGNVITLEGANRSHSLTIRLRRSSRNGTMDVDGSLGPGQFEGFHISFDGTFDVNRKTLDATGRVNDDTNKRWDVRLTGSMNNAGRLILDLSIRSNDNRYNRKVRFELSK